MEEYARNERLDVRDVEQARLKEVLDKAGLRQLYAPPDGNCLYTSIEELLGMEKNSLRQILHDYLQRNYDKYSEQAEALYGSRDGYLKHLLEDWGDELDILVAADYLNITIRVYSAVTQPLEYGSGGRAVSLVYALHQIPGSAHYSPAAPQ